MKIPPLQNPLTISQKPHELNFSWYHWCIVADNKIFTADKYCLELFMPVVLKKPLTNTYNRDFAIAETGDIQYTVLRNNTIKT